MDFKSKDASSSKDIIYDIAELQKIQNTFSRLTGLCSIIITPDGFPLTKLNRKCNLCTSIYAVKGCEVSCIVNLDNLENTNQKLMCFSDGLWSVQKDIYVHGKVVAKWLVGVGDRMYKYPDKIDEYAEIFNFKKDELIRNLQSVNQMSDEQLEIIYDFMERLLSGFYQKNELLDKLKVEEINKFKLQRAYWQSEARYSELLDNLNIGVSVYSANGHHLYSNPEGLNLFRLNEEDIADVTVKDLNIKLYNVQGESITLDMYPVNKVIKKKESIINEIYGYIVDGKQKWIKINGNPVFSEYGDFIEAVFSYTDITSEKNKIDSLVETMHLLEKSNQLALLGTYTANIQEQKWYGSQLYFDVIGVDFKRIMDLEEVSNIVHPDFRTELFESWKETVLNQKTSFAQIYKIIKQNTGEERWVQDKCQLVDVGDTQTQIVVGALQDITQIKLAEEAVLKSEKNIDRYLKMFLMFILK